MGLTNIERETIILFNEEEDTAEIYTHNKKLKNRIRKMCQLRPDLFKANKEDKNGAVTCVLPKKRLSLVLTSPPTPEASKANSQRAKAQNPLGLKIAVGSSVSEKQDPS